MCGIAGIWGRPDDDLVRGMMDALAHRGPDASGLFTGGGAPGSLGHRRLAIMDPAGGDQPLTDESGALAIVANGEIYNHPELRRALSRRHRFRTRSDSESVVHLYEDVGRTAAQRLDGMFALAIADGDDLYLARDPIGIKPLYVGWRDGAMVFASELKALAGRAVQVTNVPPGTWYHSAVGFRPYYSIPDHEPREMPLDLRLRTLRETLERAVEKRLMSDVPVGAFLSGGLDSSVVAALARRHVDELHTFSVGLEGSPDLAAAREVARHLGTVHHERVIVPLEILHRLPRILYHLESFDQDLVRSAIPCAFVSELAAEHVKVVLTGEGADELFAGYAYHKSIPRDRLHQELRRSVACLHNINLQRVDRLTMAHGLEARVPFLDLDMIDVAQTIPPDLKIHEGVEKWILRKACEDLLPPEILWRKKEQFDEGTGIDALMTTALRGWMTEEEAQEYRRSAPGTRLRSVEECVYHKILSEAFSHPAMVLANVARWSERP